MHPVYYFVSLQISHGIGLNILAFIPTVILGIIGGLLGAVFTFINLKVQYVCMIMNRYVVVKFYHWFKFWCLLIWGVVVFENDMIVNWNKRNKFYTKDKIEPQHILSDWETRCCVESINQPKLQGIHSLALGKYNIKFFQQKFTLSWDARADANP